MSPLPFVPDTLEQFVEELSSDAAIVVLESDTETRIVILSSHLESATEVIGP